ncbi:MAG: MerR family transcriptional regulator [Anaerolineae bacterium]
MQPTSLAKLLNVSSHTLRRWTGIYARFLSPGASPAKGKPRHLSEHDLRVLFLIATLRDAGFSLEAINQRLEAEQNNGWQGLPELPSEWMASSGDTIAIEVAASRAYEIAEVAVLKNELAHITQALQNAQAEVTRLQTELEALREQSSTRERELLSKAEEAEHQRQALQIQLLEAKAEVARLEGELKAEAARLEAYSLGRGKPLNVGLLLASAMVFGVVLVVLVFVVAKLIG